MLAILGWIVFGLIAGLIAKAIMPGRDPGGALITIALGIVGALIGGFLGRTLLGRGGTGTDDPGFLLSLVLAVVGAVIVLAGYRLIAGRSLRA